MTRRERITTLACVTTIADKITEAANGPQSVEVDSRKVVAQDISKLIEADKYLKATTAATNRRAFPGLKRIMPGGAA